MHLGEQYRVPAYKCQQTSGLKKCCKVILYAYLNIHEYGIITMPANTSLGKVLLAFQGLGFQALTPLTFKDNTGVVQGCEPLT